MTTTSPLIGRHITATAPRRRARTGVVLPPARRAITNTLRLAVDGVAKPIPFIPEQWTITVIAGPVYGYDDLPAEYLATRTMLRTEMRRQPADGQKPIAYYRLRGSDVADLYAVADTVAMADLSPARAEAWSRARTCARCAKINARPFLQHTDGNRYCSACREAVAVDMWTRQSRTAQTEAAEWARAVLADPAAVLITHDGAWKIRHVRAETIDGTVIADVRVRAFDNLDLLARSDETAEETAARLAEYDGSLGPAGYREATPALASCRPIGWEWNARQSGHGISHVAEMAFGDVVEDRLALWSGVSSPARFGDYYVAPRIPWDWTPRSYPPYTAHLELRRGPGGTERNLATELQHLRVLLRLMAEQQAPEPSIYRPEPVRISTR